MQKDSQLTIYKLSTILSLYNALVFSSVIFFGFLPIFSVHLPFIDFHHWDYYSYYNGISLT